MKKEANSIDIYDTTWEFVYSCLYLFQNINVFLVNQSEYEF